MHRFFNGPDHKPKTWHESLCQSAGWLNPMPLMSAGFSKVTAVSLILMQWAAPAAAAPRYSFSDMMLDFLYPGTFYNHEKYLINCFNVTNNFTHRLVNQCNVTFNELVLLSWRRTCFFATPENLKYANSCITKLINSVDVKSFNYRINYSTLQFIAISTAMITLGMAFILRIYNRPRPILINENLSYLVDAIRHGRDDDVSTFIRNHRNVMTLSDLEYAMEIANQFVQDNSYYMLHSLYSELSRDLEVRHLQAPQPAAENQAETNDNVLEKINFDKSKIHPSFLDPVDYTIMDNPVTLSTGHNVDKRTLANLKRIGHFRCPVNNTHIDPEELNFPVNTGLKNIIDDFVTKKVAKARTPGSSVTPT